MRRHAHSYNMPIGPNTDGILPETADSVRFCLTDDLMQQAIVNARKSFKIFWRELSWEARRVVSGLDLAIVKITVQMAGYGDDLDECKDDEAKLEHVWINDIEFDGEIVSGTLMNQPIMATHLHKGDRISRKLQLIDDWIYVQKGLVYGGYTVQVMRRRMDERELRKHDEAWGLKFCDPDLVMLMPKQLDQSLEAIELVDHPMSVNMEDTFRQGCNADPDLVHRVDEDGNTMLMTETMAGNCPQVKVLLQYGADPMKRNRQGLNSEEIAEMLQWPKITHVFEEI